MLLAKRSFPQRNLRDIPIQRCSRSDRLHASGLRCKGWTHGRGGYIRTEMTSNRHSMSDSSMQTSKIRTAMVFPGQGAQRIGMGKTVAESWSESRAVFEEVDDALDAKLSDLIWEGNIERSDPDGQRAACADGDIDGNPRGSSGRGLATKRSGLFRGTLSRRIHCVVRSGCT